MRISYCPSSCIILSFMPHVVFRSPVRIDLGAPNFPFGHQDSVLWHCKIVFLGDQETNLVPQSRLWGTKNRFCLPIVDFLAPKVNFLLPQSRLLATKSRFWHLFHVIMPSNAIKSVRQNRFSNNRCTIFAQLIINCISEQRKMPNQSAHLRPLGV